MNLKKFGFSVIITIVIKFFAVGIGLYTARWTIGNISTENLATMNTQLSLISIVFSIIHFGIPITIQKYFTLSKSRNETDSLWSTLALLRLISYPLGLILIWVLLPITNTSNLSLAASLYTIGFILVSDLSYRAVTDSKGNSWQYSTSDFISKLILFVGLISHRSLQYVNPLYWFIFISGIANISSIAIDTLWQRKYIKWGLPTWKIIKENKNILLYTGFIQIIIALYATTDKLFLRNFGASDEIINGYSNAYKLLDLASIVPGLSAPLIASYASKKMSENTTGRLEMITTKFANIFKIRLSPKAQVFVSYGIICLVLGIICSIGFLLLGPVIIHLIDPSLKYPASIPSVLVLGISLIAVPPIFYISAIMAFYKIEKYDMFGYIIVAIFGLTIYSLLIPTYSYAGAAIGTTLITFLDLTIKAYWLTRKKIKKELFG